MPGRGKKFVLPIILIIIIAILAVVYWRLNENWQESYKKQVADGTVQLLQSNPYDKYAVVVIVIDGLRWQEGIGDPDHEFIPHIWNDLRPMGSLLTNHRIESPTVTTSSHSAMVTGRLSPAPNDGHIRPLFPTYMQLFRDARSAYIESKISEIMKIPDGIFRPTSSTLNEIDSLLADTREYGPEKTAMYLGKDLISRINQSSCGLFPGTSQVQLVESMRDIEVTEYFRAKIPDDHPGMVFVNLGDVDECGHEAEWHYYVDSIRWADQHAWEMWQALQAESRYRDKTYFIITTDHGRHIPERGGYPQHGCFCDGCRHSFMLLIGPGIKQDFVSDQPHSELDLAPTIGKIMGFETPASTGSPIDEVFEDGREFPQAPETPATEAVERYQEIVDERDTVQVLVESLNNEIANETGFDLETQMLISLTGKNYDGEENYSRFKTYLEAAGVFNDDGSFTGDELTIVERVFLASELINYSQRENAKALTPGTAVEILLSTLAEYEGEDRVYNMEFEDFLDDFHYRQGPNEIFTEKEISMRDRMWLLWGINYVLDNGGDFWTPDSNILLRRQQRLLTAFMHEWQDANAMVGGTGAFDDDIDLVAQGLALANLADFKPWRKWELDKLGYSMDIYRTPLFSWPPRHFFYLLGQANAYAGGWNANERLKLFVNDDGSIRHDLIDSVEPLKPGDEGYLEAAAALAYGFKRFENADYNTFDLEVYPIIYQQDE